MTKVIFVHDGPRWKNDKGTQYGTLADIELYQRYLYLGNTVEFVMRVFKNFSIQGLINLNDFGLFINEIKPFNRPKLFVNYLESKREIYKQVDKADILVIRLPSTIGSVALKYAKKIEKPFIVEVVACPWDSLRNHSLLGKLYSVFSRRKLKRLVSQSDFVIYVTESFLQNRYPARKYTQSISNVVIKNASLINNKLIQYEKFNPSNEIVITTLGVVDIPYKGQRFILRAMFTLVNSGFNLKYNIVGGGNPSRLKTLAKSLQLLDRINFMGKLPHSEVFEILDSTDIYIQPSETEGLPRALIEAMSRGCACISSDAGGMPELLDSRVVFKSKDVDDLILKIKYLLDKKHLIEQSRINFEKAKKYRFDVLEKKRRDFYDKFLLTIHEK